MACRYLMYCFEPEDEIYMRPLKVIGDVKERK